MLKLALKNGTLLRLAAYASSKSLVTGKLSKYPPVQRWRSITAKSSDSDTALRKKKAAKLKKSKKTAEETTDTESGTTSKRTLLMADLAQEAEQIEVDEKFKLKDVVVQKPKKRNNNLLDYVTDVAKDFEPGAAILIQVGSFYELYGDQVNLHAADLGLRIARRKDGTIMAGFPVEKADHYCKTLVRDLGRRVVILNQIDDVTNSPVSFREKRPISRILSPGTLVNEPFADTRSSNYLLSVFISPSMLEKPAISSSEVALAWLDLTVGSVYYQSSTLGDLITDIARIKPKEIILDTSARKHQLETGEWYSDLVELKDHRISYRGFPTRQMVDAYAPSMFSDHKEAIAFNLDDMDDKIIKALGALLNYVREHIPGSDFKLKLPTEEKSASIMAIDGHTLASLELFETKQLGTVRGSLLSVIDNTCTDGGARMLSEWLSSPLLSVSEINRRLDYVEYFKANSRLTKDIQLVLGQIEDIERFLQALSMPRYDPQILLKLAQSIEAIHSLVELLKREDELEIVDETLKEMKYSLTKPLTATKKFLNHVDVDALTAENPDSKRKILPTGSKALSNLHLELARNAERINVLKESLQKLHPNAEVNLRESPQYKFVVSIKTRAHKDIKIEATQVSHKASTYLFQHIPWLELGLERDRIRARIEAEEKVIFDRFRASLYKSFAELRRLAFILSFLDVTTNFANLARFYNLVRPIVDTSNKCEIIHGRHLTVEQGLAKVGKNFVANDCYLNGTFRNTWMITGPNMGGKSTFIRQVALMSVLAQIGSFVPAESAKLGIVDRLYSRVGSADDLYRGRSTFMVEMLETTNILKHATKNSLAILDEVGRGTSSKNGLAIAYATLVHLAERTGCRALFATHFGAELYDILYQNDKERIVNYYYSDIELDDPDDPSLYGTFSFVHRLRPGICVSSHGLRIAAMAGFPNQALQDANTVLKNILTEKEIDGRAMLTGSDFE